MIADIELYRWKSGVYCFIHRETGMCYIGSTYNIAKRFKNHVRDSLAGSRNHFHRALQKYGFGAFDFEVLEECAVSELVKREEFYIALFDSASASGFNTKRKAQINFGIIPNEVTRARMSAAHMNPSAEVRYKNGSANRGKKNTPECRAKISAALKGRPKPQSVKDAVSRANKGRIHSPETIEKHRRNALARKRHPWSDEVKAKISKALMGKKRPDGYINPRLGISLSEETRAKMSKSGKGRPKSAEHRAKIGASNRAYAERKRLANQPTPA